MRWALKGLKAAFFFIELFIYKCDALHDLVPFVEGELQPPQIFPNVDHSLIVNDSEKKK